MVVFERANFKAADRIALLEAAVEAAEDYINLVAQAEDTTRLIYGNVFHADRENINRALQAARGKVGK